MRLSKEAREARRAYQRKYYQENKERVKGWQRKYWEKKATQTEQKEEQEK